MGLMSFLVYELCLSSKKESFYEKADEASHV